MSFSHWYNKSTSSGSTARSCKRSLRNKSLKLQLLLYVFLSQRLQKNTFQKMGASTGAENIPNLHPEILAMGFKTLCLHFKAIILTGRQNSYKFPAERIRPINALQEIGFLVINPDNGRALHLFFLIEHKTGSNRQPPIVVTRKGHQIQIHATKTIGLPGSVIHSVAIGRGHKKHIVVGRIHRVTHIYRFPPITLLVHYAEKNIQTTHRVMPF